MTWAGVDVGGRRKGFHLAVVSEDAVVAGPENVGSVSKAVAWLCAERPELVAVDSPITPAPDGSRSRDEERDLHRAVCALRYTPDRAALDGNPRYYEWIDHGLELYAALAAAQLPAIECFPTASWTRWRGPRGKATRARWSGSALGAIGLGGLPALLGQDARDAIGAALTAREAARGQVQRFGPIVVPMYQARTRYVPGTRARTAC